MHASLTADGLQRRGIRGKREEGAETHWTNGDGSVNDLAAYCSPVQRVDSGYANPLIACQSLFFRLASSSPLISRAPRQRWKPVSPDDRVPPRNPGLLQCRRDTDSCALPRFGLFRILGNTEITWNTSLFPFTETRNRKRIYPCSNRVRWVRTHVGRSLRVGPTQARFHSRASFLVNGTRSRGRASWLERA